jgi:hypothetical protein
MSAGAAALNRLPQHEQIPPCSVTRVTSGLMSGFDPVVGFAGDLRPSGNVGAAVLTGRCEKVAPGGRIGMQQPMRAGVRLAFRLDRRIA